MAEASNDLANLGADHNLMGNILLEAGQPDQAWEKFKSSSSSSTRRTSRPR